jgi:hypothetical protein
MLAIVGRGGRLCHVSWMRTSICIDRRNLSAIEEVTLLLPGDPRFLRAVGTSALAKGKIGSNRRGYKPSGPSIVSSLYASKRVSIITSA